MGGTDRPAGTLAPTDTSVRVLAPAKINLFLHIVGRRQDGRHDLESIFAFADIGDWLHMAPAMPSGQDSSGQEFSGQEFSGQEFSGQEFSGQEFSLSLTGPFAHELSAGGDNLVVKAAEMLAARLGQRAFPVKLELEKNLPVAAGIGGGSADAAAALRGLSSLWGSSLAADQLFDIALSLGADVPACLAGGTARVTGTGEIVTPSPALPKRCHAVLVNPAVPLSTAAVFQQYRDSGGDFSKCLQQWPDSDPDNILDALAGCRNDLSDAAIGEAPVIGDVLGTLEGQQGCRLARMSGSGATCFALFDDGAAAGHAARNLGASQPNWWVQATTLGATPGVKQAGGGLL